MELSIDNTQGAAGAAGAAGVEGAAGAAGVEGAEAGAAVAMAGAALTIPLSSTTSKASADVKLVSTTTSINGTMAITGGGGSLYIWFQNTHLRYTLIGTLTHTHTNIYTPFDLLLRIL